MIAILAWRTLVMVNKIHLNYPFICKNKFRVRKMKLTTSANDDFSVTVTHDLLGIFRLIWSLNLMHQSVFCPPKHDFPFLWFKLVTMMMVFNRLAGLVGVMVTSQWAHNCFRVREGAAIWKWTYSLHSRQSGYVNQSRLSTLWVKLMLL